MPVVPIYGTLNTAPKVYGLPTNLVAGNPLNIQPWLDTQGTSYVRVRRFTITAGCFPTASPGSNQIQISLNDGTVTVQIGSLDVSQFSSATEPGHVGYGSWELKNCVVLPVAAYFTLVSSFGTNIDDLQALMLWEPVNV